MSDTPKLVPEGKYTAVVEDAIPGISRRGMSYTRLRFTVDEQPIFATIAGPLAAKFCEYYKIRPNAQDLGEWCKGKTFNFTVKHEEWEGKTLANTRIGSLVK